MNIEIPKSGYSLKSVRDTIYWFSSDFCITLNNLNDNYHVNVETDDDSFRKIFINKLNDFSLRDMIKNETKEIRNLVKAKAFYPELINFKPLGEFDDPVNIDLRNEETE